MIPSIRVIKYQHTLDGIQARHISLPLPRAAVAGRILKALAEGRESFTPQMLAALDAGTLALDVVQGLFTPGEIQTHFRQFGFETPRIPNSYGTAGGLYHYAGTSTSGSVGEGGGAGPSGVTRAGGRTPAAAKAW
jgi:hypothetical protein